LLVWIMFSPIGFLLFPYTTLFRSTVRTGRRAWPNPRPRNVQRRRPMRAERRRRGQRGQALVEALVAALVLVPLALLAVLLGKFRSEEHTSELQSRENLVHRLLPEY